MSDTTEAVMAATYRALCEHGYADLTTQDIADESGLSTAALHYHYDTKRDLLLAFLDDLLDDFEGRLAASTDADDDPLDALVSLLDELLGEDRPDDETGFRTALLEIKAQAPYEDAYRERLTEFDRVLAERFERVLREGVETGDLRESVDPAATASFLVTAVNGAYTRSVSVGAPLAATHDHLVTYVRRELAAEGADDATVAADGGPE